MGETLGRARAGDIASIDKLQASADAAAGQVGRLYVTFLLFGLYLAITVGATTHEQLLRSAPVTLPLLNLRIPLFGFYWIAPALFLLVHFNLLLQLHLLAQKLWRLDLAIERQIPIQSARDEQRRLLHSFVFSHMLIGRHNRPEIRILFHLMIWTTVIILPVLLLLGVQVRFLPYHDAATTMWHRALAGLDILLIVVLWLRVVSGPDARAVNRLRQERAAGGRGETKPAFRRVVRTVQRAAAWIILTVAGLGAILTSVFILTFPGDLDPGFGDPMEEALLDPRGWLSSLYPNTWRVKMRSDAIQTSQMALNTTNIDELIASIHKTSEDT